MAIVRYMRNLRSGDGVSDYDPDQAAMNQVEQSRGAGYVDRQVTNKTSDKMHGNTARRDKQAHVPSIPSHAETVSPASHPL